MTPMKSKSMRAILLAGILMSFVYSCLPQKSHSRSRTSTTTVRTPQNNPPKEAPRTGTTPTPKDETPKRNEVPTNRVQAPVVKEEKPIRVNLPEVNREFRAAWIASVANINWPSKRDLSTEQQKAEVLDILDNLQANHFNAVILQVRPSADALYDSRLEPWSVFLTGQTGLAPNPYYDPLEFWIEEAHKRGIEVHAWLNPYRAHHTNGGKVTGASLVNKMPKEIVRLSNGMYWFDPSLKETQDHASRVVMDIVKRYDVDGIHFDDYFYPYASYNNGKDFPDATSYGQYTKSGGKLSRADWRRENVNSFIQRIYREIKQEKNWVKFGISPFGIWKPGFPSSVSGMSQYDQLYADAKLWLNEGWIDYFTPQLYWSEDAPKQKFSELLRWWSEENTKGRHLWPGLNTVEVKTNDRTNEILRQINITRNLVPNSKGVAHWSLKGLHPGMMSALKNGPYQEKALMPKSPWLKPIIKEQPNLNLKLTQNSVIANWDCNCTKKTSVTHWILNLRYDDEWTTEILDAQELSRTIDLNKGNKKLNTIAIQSVDRLGNESPYQAKAVN